MQALREDFATFRDVLAESATRSGPVIEEQLGLF
jgi:hypothetical protein